MTLPQVSNCTRTGLAGATYLYQASREVGWQMEPPSEVKEVVLPVKVPLVTAVALAQASACAWAAEVRAERARAAMENRRSMVVWASGVSLWN